MTFSPISLRALFLFGFCSLSLPVRGTSNSLLYTDNVIFLKNSEQRARLGALIEDLTTTGRRQLNEASLKELKKIARWVSKNVGRVYVYIYIYILLLITLRPL